MISALFLTFYIATTFVRYVDPNYSVFFHSSSNTLINLNEPPLFDINTEQFNLLSSITTTNTTLAHEIDKYYGGLYI